MKMFRISIIFSMVFTFTVLVSVAFAMPPLEVTSEGKVEVNSDLNANIKLNIKNVLHLDPLSSPPANPQEGDIYFTTNKEIKIYANGGWVSLMPSPQPTHGSVHITSGSGTWTVPAGIYHLTVSMVGGGGGGSGAYDGGDGAVRLHEVLNVSSGQMISYSVGAAGPRRQYQTWGGNGGTTTFGTIPAAGGGGAYCCSGPGFSNPGNPDASPKGTYIYGNGSYGNGGPKSGSSSAGNSGAIYIQY